MIRRKLIVFLVFLLVSSLVIFPVSATNIRYVNTKNVESMGTTQIEVSVVAAREVRIDNIPKSWKIISYTNRGTFNKNISTDKTNKTKTIGWSLPGINTQDLRVRINVSSIERKKYTFNVTAVGNSETEVEKTTLEILSPYRAYDKNKNRRIEREEAKKAIVDFLFKNEISSYLLKEVVKKYLSK